jgi:thiol-disulfide isomerase/thioredoxin
MSQTFAGLLMLCSLLPSVCPQQYATTLKKAGTALDLKAYGQKRERIGPGVGAYTEDPRKVLRAAGQAISAANSLTYEADYRGVGTMATRSPVAQGKISLSRLAANSPFKARIAARGIFFPSGSDEATIFHTTFDGRTVRKIRPKERTLMVKSLSESDPKERTLGFVTSFFGGGAYQLLMLEYLLDAPLARQAEASIADYEGRTTVNGVLCHVVYVEDTSDPKGRIQRERWFLGIKDNIPRRLEQVVMGDDGRYGAYVLTLSNLLPNVPVRRSTFTAQLSKGYLVKHYEPPKYPVLLALGGPAPDWKLADPVGKVHSLSDYRGKIVVLDFWATWCGPCIQAMPSLQRLHQDYQDRGVVVFGINTWEESNSAEFMKRSGYTYGLLLKGEEAAAAYRVSSLPTLYVIDVDGTVIHRLSGTDDNLRIFIEKHLKELGR